MTTIFAILIFGILVLLHELGHFLTAKAAGVQVNEFALFMGPALWKKQVGETLYSIRCIPFGGYCAMEGEDEETDNPRAFTRAAWWKRLIILVAGAFMNFMTGLIIVALLVVPIGRVKVLEVNSFEEWSTLDDYGLQVGDRIVEMDGEKMYQYNNFSMMLSLIPGDTHDLVVERNGERVELNGFKMELHKVTDEEGKEVERYGVTFGYEDLDLGGRVKNAWYTIVDWMRTVRLSLQMLLTGQAGLGDMTGPVGMVNEMNNVAEAAGSAWGAFLNMLYFGGFIAVNLAIMNLLPIPALDGGRVVALLLTTAIEKVTRRKINPKYEGYVHGAGMILLLILMAVILFKDIFTIFKG